MKVSAPIGTSYSCLSVVHAGSAKNPAQTSSRWARSRYASIQTNVFGLSSRQDWPRSLRAYAFPRIGAVAVSEVTTADVLAILTPIWHDKPETARRVRQRIGAVMKWAVAMGYRPDNPAGDALG